MQPIKGSTRLVGVIGWPVGHSRSPQMHNAAFAALGLPWAYVPLPVPPNELGPALEGLRALGFAGANVTVPHKSGVLSFVQHVSPAAEAVGAANTLVVRPDGALFADNTDIDGFLADLAAHQVPYTSGHALVLGAGGAGRAVAYALARSGMHVTVANRTLAKAHQLCQTIQTALPDATIQAARFPDALPQLAEQADLVVNATSLGLDASSEEAPWSSQARFRAGQVAYDLIYGHDTPFLRLAAAAGARTVSGLGMLVHQGARSFELWTSLQAPVDVMAAAALAAAEGA